MTILQKIRSWFAPQHPTPNVPAKPTDAQRTRLAQPAARADLLALLGRDDWRARELAFQLDNL